MLSKEIIGILVAAAFAAAPAVASAQDARSGHVAQPSATVADTGTGGVATIQQAQDEQVDDTTVLWALGGVGVAAAIALPLALGGGGSGGSTPPQTTQ